MCIRDRIYIQTSKSHRERLEQEMLEGLTDFSKEWERCTQQIYEAGYKLLYNEAFGRLIPKENEAAGQQETIELIGWMELYAATVSDYASDVFLFYDDDYVITEEGMSDFSLYFDVVRKHGRYPADEWRKLLEKPEAVYKPVSYTHLDVYKRQEGYIGVDVYIVQLSPVCCHRDILTEKKEKSNSNYYWF